MGQNYQERQHLPRIIYVNIYWMTQYLHLALTANSFSVGSAILTTLRRSLEP